MSETTMLDARGLSCPLPAMMVKKAIRELGSGTVEVTVDNGTARDNVERIATSAGWHVEVIALDDGLFKLALTK